MEGYCFVGGCSWCSFLALNYYSYLLSLAYLWHKAERMEPPLSIELLNNGLLIVIPQGVLKLFTKLGFVMVQARKMGHPVQIELINNGLLIKLIKRSTA